MLFFPAGGSNGRLRTLVISDTTLAELRDAPTEVRKILQSLSPESVERVFLTEETDALRDAYLSAGVIGPSSLDDAEDIACATVADADFLVSWNFKHIVHFEKIAGYQGVNMQRGYSHLRIYSPLEVI